VTQITAVPVLLATMAGIFMRQSDNDGIASVGVLMPLAGPGDLVTKGWFGEGEALLGLGSAVPWLVLLGVLSAMFFRWEPRQ
jgi:ABC-2 type transport system permease protein